MLAHADRPPTDPKAALREALSCIDPESVPNLDCCTICPDAMRVLASVYDTYAQYAETKASAMDARLSGRIRDALALERRCDGLYRSLPQSARW
jgi:hypothetical protein